MSSWRIALILVMLSLFAMMTCPFQGGIVIDFCKGSVVAGFQVTISGRFWVTDDTSIRAGGMKGSQVRGTTRLKMRGASRTASVNWSPTLSDCCDSER